MSRELSFELLFETSNDALFIIDTADGCILDANSRAGEYAGRDSAELRGARFSDLLTHPIPCPIQKLDKKPLEVLLKGAKAELLPCEITVCSGFRTGRPVYVVALRDISRSKRIMDDLRLQNEAMASVTSGVTICDARQSDLPLIYVNAGFEQITGYSAAESIGRNCRFLQGDDREQEGLTLLRRALGNEQPCKVRLRNYRKDGKLFWNELHLSPVRDDQGKLTHFVGIQIDVTARVLDRKRLEASDELKSRFIRMVSHEFRTPITGIRASAAFLRDYGTEVSSERRDRHFLNIEKALERMNRLLDDVLVSNRSDAGRIPFEPRLIDIKGFCEELLEELHMVQGNNRVVFSCGIRGNTTYLMDQALLNQILHNLLSNALKYSPDDKPVRFRADAVGSRLCLVVEDEGIGIPLEDQEQLFTPFYRASNAGAAKGTGLGLYIAKSSTELHGGTLHVSSEQGRGTRFEVNLPATVVEGGTP